jgi:hypothetical protein
MNFEEINIFYKENFKIKKFEVGLELIHSLEKLFKYKFFKNINSDVRSLNLENNEYKLNTNNIDGNYQFSLIFDSKDKDKVLNQFELPDIQENNLKQK